MESVREILERADEATVIAEKNGTKLTSISDATALANAEHVEPSTKTGLRTYNTDGSLARTRVDVAAINPESYFINRYKKKGKKLNVVVDWRAIMEQNTGSVYIKHIPYYVVCRDEADKLMIEKTDTVSDSEFIAEYKDTLNEDAMMQIAPLIAEYGTDTMASSLPI